MTKKEALADHDRNLIALLERCQDRELGVKLKEGKPKVTYMGYVQYCQKVT